MRFKLQTRPYELDHKSLMILKDEANLDVDNKRFQSAEQCKLLSNLEVGEGY